MVRKYIAAALALGLSLAGCLSGAEKSEPVNLPVPFSGALTTDTRVLVSKGPPLQQGILHGYFSGKTWEVFDSEGRSVGVVTFDLDTASEPVLEGVKRTFTLNLCFAFDDGSSVCAEGVEFIEFDFDIEPSFDAAAAAPGEPGVRAVMTKGVASGLITSGIQLFAAAVNGTLDHRYLYGSVEHADGSRTFYSHDLCTWFIPGFAGF